MLNVDESIIVTGKYPGINLLLMLGCMFIFVPYAAKVTESCDISQTSKLIETGVHLDKS